MLHAAVAILVNCALFAGVGLGPLVLLAPGTGLSALLAMAPAAGYALVSVALTCWLMREGTVASAMVPLTAALLAVSLACLAAARRSLAARLAVVDGRRLLPGLAGLALCLGLLTAPLAVGKPGWSVFRGNASDSFIYIFIAKYFDEHPRAWAFTHTAAEVEAEDPMLGPSRSMLSIRWTSGAMLAYGARLAGQGPLEFQYPFTLASFLILYAALLPFLGAMGLSPLVAALAALALATGFYGQFVLDIRAFSQINVLPLTILLAWAASLPAPPDRRAAAARLGLLGLSYLACFVNYTEIFPMVVGAGAAFVVLKAMAGRLTRHDLLIQIGGFFLGMAATWPVRFLFEHMVAQIHFTETAPQLWAEAYFSWLFNHLPQGLFGLTLAENAFSTLPGLGFLNLPPILITLLALLVTALFLLGVARALSERQRDAPLAALAFSGASLAAFAVFAFKGAPWVAGKGLSYFYPCLLAVPLYAALARPAWPGLLRLGGGSRLLLAGQAVAVAFLAWQLAFAGLRPAYAALDRDYPRYVRNHARYQTVDCDIAGLRAVLDREPDTPVAVCSADPWKWAYLGLALDADRRVRLPSQLLSGPDDAPVFLALDRPDDGVPEALASFVAAQNRSYVLYRLPRGRLAALTATLSCATVPY